MSTAPAVSQFINLADDNGEDPWMERSNRHRAHTHYPLLATAQQTPSSSSSSSTSRFPSYASAAAASATASATAASAAAARASGKLSDYFGGSQISSVSVPKFTESFDSRTSNGSGSVNIIGAQRSTYSSTVGSGTSVSVGTNSLGRLGMTVPGIPVTPRYASTFASPMPGAGVKPAASMATAQALTNAAQAQPIEITEEMKKRAEDNRQKALRIREEK